MVSIMKTAAILAVRKMCDGPIAKNVSQGAFYVCVPKVMLVSSKAQFFHIAAGLVCKKGYNTVVKN